MQSHNADYFSFRFNPLMHSALRYPLTGTLYVTVQNHACETSQVHPQPISARRISIKLRGFSDEISPTVKMRQVEN